MSTSFRLTFSGLTFSGLSASRLISSLTLLTIFAASARPGALVAEPPTPNDAPAADLAPIATVTQQPTPTVIHTLPPNFESAFKVASTAQLTGRIAFTVTVDEQDKLMILDLDGRKVRRLVDSPGSHTFPTWSPDGRWVAFSSDQGGGRDIYMVDWTGQNQRRLTVGPRLNEHPDWAHNGSVIYFTSSDGPEGRANILAVDPHSNSLKVVTRFDGRNTIPKGSPDGSKVAYSTNRYWPGWDVCELDLKSGAERCVLNGTESYCRASWRADGDALVYTYGAFDNFNIGILDRTRGARREVTRMEGKEYDAIFSPDGRYAVFSGEGVSKGVYALFLLSLGDGKVEKLLDAPFSIRYPSWSKVTTLDLEAARAREMEEAKIAAQATATALAQVTPSPEVVGVTPDATPPGSEGERGGATLAE